MLWHVVCVHFGWPVAQHFPRLWRVQASWETPVPEWHQRQQSQQSQSVWKFRQPASLALEQLEQLELEQLDLVLQALAALAAVAAVLFRRDLGDPTRDASRVLYKHKIRKTKTQNKENRIWIELTQSKWSMSWCSQRFWQNWGATLTWPQAWGGPKMPNRIGHCYDWPQQQQGHQLLWLQLSLPLSGSQKTCGEGSCRFIVSVVCVYIYIYIYTYIYV